MGVSGDDAAGADRNATDTVFETRFREDIHILCIRCEEASAVDELGYCAHCHWAAKAEVEEGLDRLRRYLRPWARYGDWCLQRGLEP